MASPTSTTEAPYSRTTVTSTAVWVSPFSTLMPPVTLVCALGMRPVTAEKARRAAPPMSYTPGTSRAAMPAILATTASSRVVTPRVVCSGPRGVDCSADLSACERSARSFCWPVWGMDSFDMCSPSSVTGDTPAIR